MRCDTCGRSWTVSARFCGWCGERLGSGPEDRSQRTGTGRERGSSRVVVAALLCVAALAVVGTTLGPDGVTGALGGATEAQVVRGDVSVPAADVAPEGVGTVDRGVRRVDCRDDLQDLPRHIRRYSLYTGRLEWQDGRLCTPVSAGSGDLRPRCDPPRLARPPCP